MQPQSSAAAPGDGAPAAKPKTRSQGPPWRWRDLGDVLTTQPLVRKLLENFSWLLAERFFALTVQFFVSVWFIRYLGPERYGTYSYVVSFAALFGSLAGLGLNPLVVRELSLERRPVGTVLATAWVLTTLTGLATYALILAVAVALHEEPHVPGLVAIAATYLIVRPTHLVECWFQAEILSKYPAAMRTLSAMVVAAAKLAMVAMQAPLVAFVWLFVAENALIALMLFYAFATRGPRQMRFVPERALGRLFLRDTWPLVIAGLSTAIYMKIDRVMLGEMAGAREVGIYSTAATISELWYFLPVAVISSVFPLIVRAREMADTKVYARRMQALYDLVVLLCYVVALPLGLLATPLVEALFGADYRASAQILQVHTWALVFGSLAVARSRYLVAESLTRLDMITTMLGAATNVGLNLWLIPHFGGLGAAWATLVSYAVSGYLSGFVVGRLRQTTAQQTRALAAPFRLGPIWAELRRTG